MKNYFLKLDINQLLKKRNCFIVNVKKIWRTARGVGGVPPMIKDFGGRQGGFGGGGAPLMIKNFGGRQGGFGGCPPDDKSFWRTARGVRGVLQHLWMQWVI